jgi:hypothetical protein
LPRVLWSWVEVRATARDSFRCLRRCAVRPGAMHGRADDKLIGTTKRSHGILNFHPTPGPGGSRQIVAMATEGGVPLILSPGTSAPRFDRVRGAKQYVVLVTMRSGLKTDRIVRRASLGISVPSVGPAGGTVTVRALGDGLTTVDGPVARAKVQVAVRHRRRHRAAASALTRHDHRLPRPRRSR